MGDGYLRHQVNGLTLATASSLIMCQLPTLHWIFHTVGRIEALLQEQVRAHFAPRLQCSARTPRRGGRTAAKEQSRGILEVDSKHICRTREM